MEISRRSFLEGGLALGAVVALGGVGSILPGCSSSSSGTGSTPDASATHVVVDVMGRKVEVKNDLKSIIAVPWPWTSFVFAVDGSPDKIASMSATALASYKGGMFERLAPGLADSKTGFIEDSNKGGGSFGTLNVEELAQLNPDLVIIYKRDANAMLETLEKAGVTTVVFDFGDLKEVQDGLLLLGECIGGDAVARAKQIIDWHNKAYDLVISRTKDLKDEEKPSVLLLHNAKLQVYNSDFSNNMFKHSGATIPWEDEVTSAGNGTVDFEQIAQWDPDYILLGNFSDHTPEMIYNNEMAGRDWSQLKAVRNKHVYKLPQGIYRWDPPSTEAHLRLYWEAKLFHPELFTDINLEEETREFYSVLFGHSLTEDDFNLIYHNAMNANSEPVKLNA